MPGQFGKLGANLVEREPYPLGEDDKRDLSYDGTRVPAMARIVALGMDEPLFLIKPQR